MLTGDKLETAVNIAYSCGHFSRCIDLLQLKSQDESDFFQRNSLLDFKKRIWDHSDRDFGLVIDGQTLALAMTHSRELLSEVASRCRAVVCCRMSPIQKAEVVKLVKGFSGEPITAAVGDGANDVSMIQEAHVGLGIFGKEGRQAACCSDFAFARFSFLRRVLLVHGQWYYWRLSTVVQFFFYKNIAFVTPAVFFAMASDYSAQSLYGGMTLSLFNTTFTALPILFYGLFEQNFSDEDLLRNLHLYRRLSRNAQMNWQQFIKWNVLGLWHSCVIYLGTYLFYDYDCAVFYGGPMTDLYTYGTYLINAVVFVVTLKLLIQSHFWTLIYIGVTAFSLLVAYVGFMLLYSAFYLEFLANNSMEWIYMVQASSGSGWLLLLLLIVICLLPDVLLAMWEYYNSQQGVVLNMKRSPEEQVRRKFERMISYMNQKKSASYDFEL